MTSEELKEIQDDVKELREKFVFDISLEPADHRVMYLHFADGREYRIEHPGALVATSLFFGENSTQKCFEFFIKKCITPVSNTKTKVINAENLTMDEAMELWIPLAWRFLRHEYRIAAP